MWSSKQIKRRDLVFTRHCVKLNFLLVHVSHVPTCRTTENIYLARDVFSPLKLHLQIVQWHSGFFITGTRAGGNLLNLLRSFPVRQLVPIHPSLVFGPWSCRWLLDLAGCALMVLIGQRGGARYRRRGLLLDRRGPDQGWMSAADAGDGVACRWNGGRLLLIFGSCLFPALLQSTQVARAQGGCSTFKGLVSKNTETSSQN